MKQLLLFTISLLFLSCNSNQLSKDFNCQVEGYTNLEATDDFKNHFTIKFPKNWNTKLYYDDVVSSISSADTTISLTKTTIMDASFIVSPTAIDAAFINKIKNENIEQNLEEVKTQKTTLLSDASYFNLAKGKRGKYQYHILNVFSKADKGFLHVKTEVYGDSLVDERLCKAIQLIENIRLK